MVELEATLDGAKELSVQLGISAKALEDFTLPLAASSAELIKSFDMNFDDRGSLFTDGGWAPRKKSEPWPLLEETGAMRHGFVSSIGPGEAVIGNSDPKFPFHQTGTSRGIPSRLMMKIDQQRRDFIIKAFQLHIVTSLQNLAQ